MIEEAQRRILERVQPLESESLGVGDAAGRVVAEAVRAVVDLPPFPSSSMDGYAVRSADVPGVLRVVDRAAAGAPATRPVLPGEAIAIATGAVVPDGADAVVPVEYVVENDNNSVGIDAAVASGSNVRSRGGDARAGDVVVDAGAVLGPAALAAAAAAGVASVVCARRPRVAVLATGSELRAAGDELRPGEIYEANTTLVAAALAAGGGEIERLPPVRDDADAHRAALARGLGHDVLVTSGGVSVGEHDLVRAVLAELGVEEVFWGVAVKPGKPLAFGVRGRTLVFGLPGNPVAALVGCELFVKPALRALQGARDPLPRFLSAPLRARLRATEGRDELLRARVVDGEAGVELEPLSGRESHMIVRAAAADALVLVRAGSGELPAGTTMRYLPLGG